MITKENLIKFGCDQYPKNCNPKILKVVNQPKLEYGHVFIELNQDGMKVLAHSPKVDQNRLQIFTHFIAYVVKKFNLNLNFKFILNTYDEPAPGDFPVFSFCGNSKYNSNIVVPDPHLLSRYMGKTFGDNQEFQQKNNKVVFRGSDTGPFPCPFKNERIMACIYAQDKPNLNFKISNFVSYTKKCLDLFKIDIEKISGHYLNSVDQSKCKYIADINGNTAAWDRPCWALGLNSILIKVQLKKNSDETWYSKYMELENIVPRFSLSELDSINLDPSFYNPRQQEFCKILLDPTTQEEYLKSILVKYDSQYNK